VPSARCAGASYTVATVSGITAEERREATLRRQQVSGEQSGLILLSPDPKCVYGDEIVTRPPFAQSGYVLVCKPFDRARFGQLACRIFLSGGCQVRRRQMVWEEGQSSPSEHAGAPAQDPGPSLVVHRASERPPSRSVSGTPSRCGRRRTAGWRPADMPSASVLYCTVLYCTVLYCSSPKHINLTRCAHWHTRGGSQKQR